MKIRDYVEAIGRLAISLCELAFGFALFGEDTVLADKPYVNTQNIYGIN